MSGIPSWARVGAKCVLVDLSPAAHGIHGDVQAGDICIIRATRHLRGVPVCQVDEANGKWGNDWMEWTKLSRFRPLHTLETDIEAHFKALLSTDHKVDA